MNPVTFVHTVGDQWVEVPGHNGQEPTITVSWSEVERALIKTINAASLAGTAIQSIQVNDGGLRIRMVNTT